MNLSAKQKNNIQIIMNRLVAKGITNPYAQAAVLSIVGKESGFIPQNENLNYSAARLLQVFPSTIKTPAQANALANKPELIANTIYGGRYGNAANEGYKYRGRGYNQITFKDTYRNVGTAIGKDLVANPDLLLDPTIAADAMIVYFLKRIKLYYPSTDINKIKSLNDSLTVFYNANAGGPGKHLRDTTGGYDKAKNSINDLYTLVNNNKAATGGGLFFLILTLLAIAKRETISNWINKQLKKS